MASPQTTHRAPSISATHDGAFAKCSEYPCAPNREATAYLREDAARTATEQAALDVVRDKAWVLWHADDRDVGILLVLSRAGLLRDKAHEAHLESFGAANAAAVERRRLADGKAIRQFEGLAKAAADLLDGGTAPAEVAAQLRALSAGIVERLDRQAAAMAPADGPKPEAVPT